MTTQHNFNLNTAVGLDMKMTLQTPPPPHPTKNIYNGISYNKQSHNNDINKNNNNTAIININKKNSYNKTTSK